MKSRFFFVSILILSVVNCYSQNVIKIYVASAAEDPVGETLVYKVKEEFRKSKSFDLQLTDKGDPKFVLKLTSMDKFKGDNQSSGYETLFTIILMYDNGIKSDGFRHSYLSSQIGFSGRKRIDEVATEIVAYSLEAITKLLEAIQRNN